MDKIESTFLLSFLNKMIKVETELINNAHYGDTKPYFMGKKDAYETVIEVIQKMLATK